MYTCSTQYAPNDVVLVVGKAGRVTGDRRSEELVGQPTKLKIVSFVQRGRFLLAHEQHGAMEIAK